MKRYLIFLYLINLLFASLPVNASINISSKIDFVYVSNTGNDNNNGMDKYHPFKTISAALRTGKDIKLRCGDVFYENVILTGQNLSTYGNGNKPKLCGWKFLNNAKWENINGCIWRLDLENEEFTGRTAKSYKYLNNIGLIVNVITKSIYGLKKQCLYKKDCIFSPANSHMNTWLNGEMDFAQTPIYGRNKLKSEDFKYLYIYSSTNPNNLHLAVSTYGNGITASNSEISGIAIEGFSCHGIAAGSNVRITNCDISYIGGAQQVGYPLWVRYGNGIEFYISKYTENGYVAHNHIGHTFDCATTIQGSKRVGAYPKNIIIEKNVIYNCRQAFEYFLNNDDKETNETYDCINCEFRNNKCIESGYNGFGLDEFLDSHILSYQNDYRSSIKITNNIFIGGKALYFAIHPENLKFGPGNKYYLTEGTVVLRPGNIIFERNNIARMYKKLLAKKVNLRGVQFVLVNKKKLDKLIKRNIPKK